MLRRRMISILLLFTLLLALPLQVLATGQTGPETEGSNQEPQGQFVLLDMEAGEQDTTLLRVQLMATGDCKLLAALYTEGGQMMALGTAQVTGAEEAQWCDVILSGLEQRPEHFLLRAFLVDMEGDPLCPDYECIDYTRAYAEFLEVTPLDFPGQTVLGDEEQGFLVLKSSVLELAQSQNDFTGLTENDDGALVLTGPGQKAKALKVGDQVLITDEAGQNRVVEIESASLSGDSLTLKPKQDTDLTAFSDFIRLDVTTNTDSSAGNLPEDDNITLLPPEEPISRAAAVPGDLISEQTLKTGFTWSQGGGTISGEAELKFTSTTSFYYAPSVLGTKAVQMRTATSVAGALTGKIQGEFDLGEIDGEKWEIPVIPPVYIPVLAGAGQIQLKIGIPISLIFSGTGELQYQYESTNVTVYQNGKLQNSSQASNSGFYFQAKAKITATVGLRLTLALNVLSGALTIQTQPEAGVKFEATLDPLSGGATENGEKHDCSVCLEGDAALYAKLPVSMVAKAGKWTFTFFDITAAEGRWEIGVFHCSSKTGFGLGPCPFKSYLIKAQLSSADGLNLSAGSVLLQNNKTDESVELGYMDQVFLPSGSYKATAAAYGYLSQTQTFELVGPRTLTFRLAEEGKPDPNYNRHITEDFVFKYYQGTTVTTYGKVRVNGLLTFQASGEGLGELDFAGRDEYWHRWPDQSTNGAVSQTIRQIIFLDNSFRYVTSYGFSDAHNLHTVDFGGNAIELQEGAFSGARVLKNLKGMENLTYVGRNAFASTPIEGPLDLTGIGGFGESPFWKCKELKSVKLGRAIGSGMFRECSRLESVDLGSVTEIPSLSFYYCTSLKSLTIPGTVTTIGKEAFHGSGLTSIYIPSTVTNLGENLFPNCKHLQTVNIQAQNMTTTGVAMFNGCSSLTNVTLPDTITELGADTFYNCTSLETYVVPEGVQRINYQCFGKCTALTQVYIPASVVYLDEYAFRACTGLRRVDYGGTMEQWNALAANVSDLNKSYITIHCTDGVIEQ